MKEVINIQYEQGNKMARDQPHKCPFAVGDLIKVDERRFMVVGKAMNDYMLEARENGGEPEFIEVWRCELAADWPSDVKAE